MRRELVEYALGSDPGVYCDFESIRDPQCDAQQDGVLLADSASTSCAKQKK